MGCKRDRLCGRVLLQCGRVMLILLISRLAHAQAPPSFTIPTFDAAALKQWNIFTVYQTYADRVPTPQVLNPNVDNVLSLTRATGDVVQAALAVFKEEIAWGQGFEASFSFRLYNAGVNRNKINGTAYDPTNPDVGGDGITFAIFSTLPTKAGGPGGALGYFEGDPAAMPQSMAVEFDTWNNPEFADPVNEGGVIGGDTNHIGLDLRGDVNSARTVHINNPFNDGGIKNVWISYFDAQKTLQVFYNDINDERPASPVFTAQMDLSQVLGEDTQTFYAGFTGSSATAYENQTIIDFAIRTLNSTEEPVKPLPQPEPVPDPIILLARQVANYTDFKKDWVPAGSAAVLPNGPLQLTSTKGVAIVAKKPDAPPGQATLQRAIDCTIGCSFYGAFAITNDVRLVDTSDLVAGGDGLALVLTATPALPDVENTDGNLGYAGIPKSVAVEVDTWFDKGLDPVNPKNPDGSPQLSGSDGNHLGVSVQGNPKSIATYHLPAPANDNELSATGKQLRVKHMWAVVDNLSKEIKVFYNEVNNTKPIAPVLTAPLDIETEIGTTQLYPSFTASTSTGLSNHFITAAAFAEAVAILNTGSNNNTAVKAASFPGFDASTSRAFTPAGTATNVTTDSGSLTLTNATNMDVSAGSLSLIAPIDITDGLQIQFSPRMTSNPGGEPDPADGSTARDGMALVLLAEKPKAAGQPGSGIGYGGLPKSVAIELDTYYNDEWDPAGDGNHIGFNMNGGLKSDAWANVPDDMADGQPKYVWLDYDAQEKMARVYYNYRDTKPAAPILTHSINLEEALGTTTPYVMVTAGTNATAGAAATNELTAITFNNVKPPPPEATNITKFDATNVGTLSRGGVAAGLQPTADGALPLTSALKGPQAGLVRAGPAVDISKGLSAHIQVALGGDKGEPIDPSDKFPGRDGVAILISASNSTVPGTPASGLGYGGLKNTVAVELDTWADAAHDPDGNHIGINANGNLKSLSTVKLPASIADGAPKDLWVDYNTATKTLSVYYNPTNDTKPNTPILTQPNIDLPAVLKSDKAFVSVTSGTDGTAGAPTKQLLKTLQVTPGNPDATKPRSFDNFADPAVAASWAGGFGANKDGLALTDPTAVGAQNGATVLKEPVDVSSGFSTYLQVQMNPGGPTVDPADSSSGPSGTALVFLPTNVTTSATPKAQAGDGIGYAGIPKSVAVELDTVYNAQWDPALANGTIDGNHVGINLNGNTTSVASAHVPGNLADGKPKHVWVDYNSVSKELKVFLNPNAAEKPLDPVLTAPVDIEAVTGTDTPFLAVTSGTDGAKASALLKEVKVLPGRVGAAAEAAFAGPNSLAEVDAAQLQQLTRSGDAASLPPNPDGSIPLTNANVTTPQSSIVFLPAPVDLSQGLSSHFQIKMTSPAGADVDPADSNPGTGGAAIVFLPSNTTQQGAADSGLGYKDIAGKSVAIELDKYYDQSVSDPLNPQPDGTLQVQGADGNHIGLDVDGSVQSLQSVHIPRDFNGNVPNNVWVDYDPAGQVYVYFNGPNATKPAAPVLSVKEDIVSRLGGPNAYIAITSGTKDASTITSLTRSRVVNAPPVAPSAAALGPPPVTTLTFNATEAQTIKTMGAAAAVEQPDAMKGMKLTDPSVLEPQGSLVVVSPRVDISRGLSSHFEFILAANEDTDDLDPSDNLRGRDGVAIVLMPNTNISQGQPGGGLGYGGINKSVVVELDSFYDEWDPLNSAGLPDGNHIGINTNGELTSIASASVERNLNDAKSKHVWVDVDSVSKALYVYQSDTDTKPDTPVLATVLDVVGTLGTDHPVLAVTSGTQGTSSVTAQFLKSAEFSSKQPQAALAAMATVPKPLPPPGTVTSKSFSVFNPETLQNFNLIGSASSTTPDSFLALNDNTPGPQYSMAIYKTPLDASTAFSVYVKPQVNASQTSPTDPMDNFRGRDGLAVVLMATNTTFPGDSAKSSGIGYAGLEDSVAVELDSWFDNWDPDGNHVGININGNTTSVATARVLEDISNGKDKHLWVDYDNMAKSLSVFLSEAPAKPSQPVLTYPIDLPAVLGTESPYVAVTSGTADAAAVHTIKSLSFRSGQAMPNAKTRSFDSFTPEALKSLQLSGAAVSDPFVPGAVALTTDNEGDQAGIMKLAQPVDLSQGASTFVQFQMNNTARAAPDAAGGLPGGDGMTIMLLGDGATGNGKAGPGLGYQGIAGKSLAVELDTAYNKDYDPKDPVYPWGTKQLNGSDGNHLGINLNGDVKSVVTRSIPIEMNDGGVHSAWLDVDNMNKLIHVYYNPDNDTKPALPSLSYNLDSAPAELLGTNTPTLAISGGSTNGGSVHRLRSMSVTEGPVPNPYSFPSANGVGWNPWNLAGTATAAAGKLQLTSRAAGAQVGRAVLPTPINMTKGFSTMFVADIKAANNGQPQDGIALALVNSPLLPDPAGNMGYDALKKSVAVELDPFYNSQWDPKDTSAPPPQKTQFKGPDGNHVGVNVNGDPKSVAAVHIPTPLAEGLKYVWVDYDNVAKSLWVYLSDASIKPAEPVLSHGIDVEKTIGTKWPYVVLTSSSSDGNTITSVRSLSVIGGKPSTGPKTSISKKKKLSGGEIAGIVIGIIAAAVLLALLTWWLCNNCECCRAWGFGKRKQRKADPLYVV